MLSPEGATYFGYTSRRKKNAMGGVFSKARRVVIDLTRDEDDPPATQQRQLPQFAELLGKQNASARDAGVVTPPPPTQSLESLSPLAALEAALQLNLKEDEPHAAANEPKHDRYVPTAICRSNRAFANATSQVEDVRSPRRQAQSNALPSDVEVIDLVSPEGSPELPDKVHSEELCQNSQADLADRNPHGLSHGKPVELVPAQSLRRTSRIVTRAQTKAREVLLKRGGSKDDPILILDFPEPALATSSAIRPPVQLPVPRPAAAAHDVAAHSRLVLFADGSFSAGHGGSGVAFWRDGHWNGKAFALGRIPGKSYEAEARAILEAFKIAGDMVQPHHRMVEVCTDHKGLVETFYDITKARTQQTSSWAPKILQMGTALRSRGVQVRLTWVKGHGVHAGNQMADLLAGIGSERSAQTQGVVLGNWFNPNVGEVHIGPRTMVGLSAEAMAKAAGSEGRAERRAERRAHKLEVRVQRRLMKNATVPVVAA